MLTAAKQCPPAEWWNIYGREECPNLAHIAIRILSQTVSSSHCERNWSTFALIHTKTRNRLKMNRLMHLVLCHYNMRLRERQLRRTYDHDSNQIIDLDQIFHEDDPLQTWIREEEDAVLDDRDNEWLDDVSDDEGNNNNSKSDSGGSDGVPITNLETQNTDSEPIHQRREQPQGPTSESEHTGRRYIDVNELTARHRNINSYDGMYGTSEFSGRYNSSSSTYGVQPDYNSSSNPEFSSTYNPYVGYEDANNSSFDTTLMSSFFSPVQPYPHSYFNTEDDEMIQPARHSLWQ
ncbi:uncharacterized protein LOC144544653 [Carex rostrata]